MDFWFNQLSRMEYGAECIAASKQANSKFVDSITFGISHCGQEGCISEAKIVWLQIESNAAPFPHIEIFSDGITAAYSNEFINALMMLKDKGNFTPAECTEALIACGFTDTSNRKLPEKNEKKFYLAAEIYNFLLQKGYPSFIQNYWYEDNCLVIQNVGTKTGTLNARASLKEIYDFAESHAQPFIPQLAAISANVYLGLDGFLGGELTGTWTYHIYMPEHDDDKKVFETLKARYEDNANAKIVVTPDYNSYDNGDFKVNVIANNYKPLNDSNKALLGVEDEKREVVEWCSHCETENGFRCNPEKDGYIAVCENCHNLLVLCSECQNTNDGKCDWTEKGCCMCTPRNFLDFLANRYNGVTSENSYGEYTVSIPHHLGRTVKVTYETEGLEESETYYDIKVICSSSEAETEKYKDNPVVLTNSYKSVHNAFKMIDTLLKND